MLENVQKKKQIMNCVRSINAQYFYNLVHNFTIKLLEADL